jgi:hypothetical protein
MKSLLNLGVATVALFTSFQAYAFLDFDIDFDFVEDGKRKVVVDIPMNGQKAIRGEKRIALKAKIKQERPDLDLTKADLKKVIVTAKTKAGQGTVYVSEGHWNSREKVVDASPRANGFKKRGGFSDTVLRTPREMKKVKWGLHTNGNFKIKHIQVVFEMPKRLGGRMQTASCTYKLDTLFGESFGTYTEDGRGRGQRAAKRNACVKAKSTCEAQKKFMSKLLPFIKKIAHCVKK